MSRSAIVSTSTSGLALWPEPHDIRVLHLHVHMQGQNYLDGVDIHASEFQEWMLDNPGNMATTSPPSKSEVVEFFKQLAREGYEEVLVLTLSSKVSKTFEVVQSVVPLFKGRLRIWAFDTMIVGHGEARLALEVERALSRGHSIAGIVSRLMLLRSQQRVFLTVGKLDYLVKSGRLSAAAGFIANLVNIRPILHMSEGYIKPYAKVRTVEKAVDEMVTAAKQYAGKSPHRMQMINFGGGKMDALLEEILRDRYPMEEIKSSPMTPVVAAHTGPNTAGLLVWRMADLQGKKAAPNTMP